MSPKKLALRVVSCVVYKFATAILAASMYLFILRAHMEAKIK